MGRIAVVLVAAALGVTVEAGAVVPLGLDLYRPAPEDNPLTPSKIALGRRLFHDRRLSRNGSLSCAGCHDPRHAFTSPVVGASEIGTHVLSRNVPTLVNRAWGVTFFWDGRAASLEEQVLQPILNPRELGLTPDGLLAVARSSRYRAEMIETFGAEPRIEHVAAALASYVRTIVAGNSPFDRYVAGRKSALDSDARAGLDLFSGKAGCIACHTGPNLTDERFHNTGVAWRTGRPTDDGRALVSHRPEDSGAFKTPTLRQVRETAPYMHDGSFATLAEVIDFYDRGGHPNPGLDSRIRPRHLQPHEKRALLAFLTALTGDVRDGR